jgi:hypothetical protein
MGLMPDAIDDLVELTYNKADRAKWVDLSLNNQRYSVASRWLKAKKAPTKATPKQTWKLQVSNTDAFRWTNLYSVDEYDVKNLAVGAEQPWAIATSNYVYDINEEEFQGGNREIIIDLIVMREHSMYSNLYEGLESAFWSAPSSSTLAKRPLSGIPFWLQKNATVGFNGGDPSGFAAGAGGVSTGTYINWSNYSGAYVSVTRNDLISKWLKATEFTHFESPHQFPQNGGGDPDWMFYTTYSVYEAAQQFLDARNDNLSDLAGTGAKGRPTFKGVPLQWIPELTHSTQDGYDSANPLYGVNWNTMDFAFLKGKDMVRTKPQKKDNQHNVRVVHVDSSCNLRCNDRRQNFVLHVA